jgi:hypothetical protein
MLLQDIRRHVWDQLRQKDFRAFDSLLPAEVVILAAPIAAVPLGTGTLHLVNLVWLSVASALHSLETFKEVLDHTIKLVEDGPHYHGSALDRGRHVPRPIGPHQRHDPRPHDPGSVTEEAFTQARRRLPQGFWVALIVLLTERFIAQHDARTRFRGFRLLGLDGTCLNLADWKPLRDYFGTAHHRNHDTAWTSGMVGDAQWH